MKPNNRYKLNYSAFTDKGVVIMHSDTKDTLINSGDLRVIDYLLLEAESINNRSNSIPERFQNNLTSYAEYVTNIATFRFYPDEYQETESYETEEEAVK